MGCAIRYNLIFFIKALVPNPTSIYDIVVNVL